MPVEIDESFMLSKQTYDSSYRGFYIAFVNSSVESGRQRITSYMTCREEVAEMVRASFHNIGRGRNYYYSFSGGGPAFDTEKLRLLILLGKGYTKEEQKSQLDKLFSAKRILNMIERAKDWSLTKIAQAESKDDPSRTMFLVTANKVWQQHPVMLSLFILILRLGYHFGPFKADTLDDFDKINITKSGDGSTWDLIKPHYRYILANTDFLFGNAEMKDNYPDKGPSFHFFGPTGINSLINKSTFDPELNKRMLELSTRPLETRSTI